MTILFFFLQFSLFQQTHTHCITSMMSISSVSPLSFSHSPTFFWFLGRFESLPNDDLIFLDCINCLFALFARLVLIFSNRFHRFYVHTNVCGFFFTVFQFQNKNCSKRCRLFGCVFKCGKTSVIDVYHRNTHN